MNVNLKIKRRTKRKTQDLLLFSLGIKHGAISEAATISIPYLFHIRKKWGYKCKLIRNYLIQLIEKMSLNSPFNINDFMFLIFDSGQGDADIIFIFGSNQGFPTDYFQIYTIHAQIKKCIPLAFALCSQTKPKELILTYPEKLSNTWQNLLPTF